VVQDLAVLTPEGIVGRTFRVGSDYSDVLLIIDSNSTFDAIIERSRARGIVRGAKGNMCRLEFTKRTEDIVAGDTVVSSGLGGIFPKGIRVGVISEVESKPYGIFMHADIIPSVDFSKLEEVFVVLKK
jgi:rod shape-determining protein MreC